MIDENPYQATAAESVREPDEQSRRRRQLSDDERVVAYAQLGLRLLGVLFVVDGLCGVVGSIVYGAMQTSELQQAGYQPFPDSYVFGWFACSVAMCLAGVYFVTGGVYVLEQIFLPSPRSFDVDENRADERTD